LVITRPEKDWLIILANKKIIISRGFFDDSGIKANADFSLKSIVGIIDTCIEYAEENSIEENLFYHTSQSKYQSTGTCKSGRPKMHPGKICTRFFKTT
jgi:hypothetical protein